MKDITLAVHAGSRKDDVNGAINQPINTTSKQSRPCKGGFVFYIFPSLNNCIISPVRE